MNINKISVEGLFGDLKYSITLNKKENITIIYAPNGYGKSTLLGCVENLFKGNIQSVLSVLFKKITIDFNDESFLTIAKRNEEELFLSYFKENRSHDYIYKVQDNLEKSDGISLRKHALSIAQKLGHFSPIRRGVGLPNLFRDLNSDEILEARQIIAKYEKPKFPTWLEQIFLQNTTHIISTQRLDDEIIDENLEFHSHEIPRRMSTVERYSKQIVDKIRFVGAQYSRLSQQLDQEFPKRLIEALKNADDIQFCTENFERVENMQRRLVESGLLERSRLGKLDLQKEDAEHIKAASVLKLYTADQEKKLEVFDEILNKIETIKEIINSHFQRKVLKISPNEGYTLFSNNNDEIPLNKLSSGEQHQLVLFHSLLFNMQPKSLIMIDEPEISLHVAWQQVFIENLQKISKNLNCHFLIATHSPQIINDNWDFTQSLVQKDS